jgi:DNA-binding XRE family transcriptional regulator
MTKFSLEEARAHSKKFSAELAQIVMSDLETKTLFERKYREIELALLMRETREKAHLTQEALAKRMHTTKSAISRLESSGITRHSPSIETILKYVHALGYDLRIKLIPLKRSSRHGKM